MNRMTWVDNLRGMSIIAVIFLHSTIAVAGNAGHLTGVTQAVNQLLEPIRLGLMFFVSGLFVESGLNKGKELFLRNKVKSILYPFVIWVVIYGGLKLLFNSRSNNPQSPLNILLSHLSGGGDITWFLHSLFIFFLIIPLVRRIPIYLVIPTALALSSLLPEIPSDSIFAGFDNSHVNKSLYLFPFFYLADWLVRRKMSVLDVSVTPRILLTSLLAFVVLSCIDLFIGAPDRAWQAPLALLSVPFFVWLAAYSNIALITFIGANSIVFYLSHYLAIQAFAKLIKFRSESLWFHDALFLAAFATALALPGVICLVRRFGMLNFLFTMKKKAPENRPVTP
ncbi:acyltransferase [Erwinia sp. OLTSP20]|uniref:acyltransferase family protein n=1 Tax=unclassified Erwinia TaxID=2622719 RepID=UPI000C1A671F|nr:MULTISPECIES: acyltransferase family protein [unclassified Erwinia]PIJ49789.1 acyltransferase [Erwinia sp. OAMSP11]PIJ70889.1 acyltransferase [Erwinia sp. OLSSP12]PIJ80254.1 acyltransferase [Erwinia sp. OLCASP19]PIJ82378.1 acyltransferase [Erwinia sp. OLMTSP26]PIJ85064.1 acyltransferase [Erwinia sp. OLMDSP33]